MFLLRIATINQQLLWNMTFYSKSWPIGLRVIDKQCMVWPIAYTCQIMWTRVFLHANLESLGNCCIQVVLKSYLKLNYRPYVHPIINEILLCLSVFIVKSSWHFPRYNLVKHRALTSTIGYRSLLNWHWCLQPKIECVVFIKKSSKLWHIIADKTFQWRYINFK